MRRGWSLSAALAGIAAVTLYAMFARDIAKARQRVTDRSRTVSTGMGRLEYAVAGEGAPILVAHGASGGFDQALDITGGLAAHGYRLVAPSRFGYLASDIPAMPTIRKQAESYAELLDYLEIDRTFVIGISAGSWSAIEFAIRYPWRCRALVLLAPANLLGPWPPMKPSLIGRSLVGSDLLIWAMLKLGQLFPELRDVSASEKARAKAMREHLLPVSSRKDGLLFDYETCFAHEAHAPERIACPILTVSAQDDPLRTAGLARAIAAAVADGQALIYPDGGHRLIGHYDSILAAVAAFFDRHNRPQVSIAAGN